jgi:hypothetical protein
LDRNGVPVAQIGEQKDRAVVFDGAGRPLGWADTFDGKHVIHALDGAVRRYVTGVEDDRAVAAFALEWLPVEARLLLARKLDSLRSTGNSR